MLRGPASSLYGSGGMGGVIAFRTVRAEDFLAPGEKAGMTFSGGYPPANREKLGTVMAYRALNLRAFVSPLPAAGACRT